MLALLSCSNGGQGTDNYENSPDDSTRIRLLEDSIPKLKNKKVDSFPITTEIIIYPFFEAHLVNGMENHEPIKKVRFVPLAESYRWSEHPDSLAIENKNLGAQV